MYRMKAIQGLLLASMIGLAGLLGGCGGGGAGTTGSTTGGTTSGTTTTATPTLTVTLTDAATGNALTNLSAGVTGRLTATVKDKNGSAVTGALVTFSTDSAFGTFNPASGTTLTDASGVATMLISGGATSGASSATVTAVWKESGADVSASGSVNYIVSAAGAVTLTITAPAFGVGASSLSAYGTTSVSVTVGGTTSPLNVSFTSSCATSGKAVLTASVTTINNVATASYRDNGCGNIDPITASVTTGVTATSPLTVTSPSAGSIQFVSATPSIISLKGTGSATLPEVSTVKFKILDTAGNPISKTVDFSLSTTLGAITLSNGAATASATSDAATGEVQIGVNSGTLPTPLRVLATINGTTIKTQSNQLTITTGLPDQAHTSLSYSTFNIDGWRFDGTTTILTMRLADHLSNPVPDGTVVNFVAEGGRVDASCTTKNNESECTATFTSQNLRPSDGRITVLAYAVGEESFTDLNSNGTADAGELIDANGVSTALPEAWIDYDESGAHGPTEPFFNFDGSTSAGTGTYSAANEDWNGTALVAGNKYNGILCTAGAPICSVRTAAHVYRNVVIVLSDSEALSTGDVFTNAPSSPLDLGGCTPGKPGTSTSFNLLLRDLHSNALPAGTTVHVSTFNGMLTQGANYVVPNTIDNYQTNPGSSAFSYPITIENDAPTTGTCVDPTPTGILSVTITSPRGVVTTYNLNVNN